MHRMYDDLQAFCLFMGYTRSGHSLVGACLDAHPEAAIAHEGKIFAYDADKHLTGGLHNGNPAASGALVARSTARPPRAARDAAGRRRRSA